MISEIALTIASLWLGSLFAYTGALKLLASPEENVRAVQAYRLVAPGIARVVGLIIPYAELITGASILLTPTDLPIATLAAVAFGMAFTFAAASVMVRGVEAGCGCAGRASERVGFRTLARAILVVVVGTTATVAGNRIPQPVGLLAFGLAIAPTALGRVRKPTTE